MNHFPHAVRVQGRSDNFPRSGLVSNIPANIAAMSRFSPVGESAQKAPPGSSISSLTRIPRAPRSLINFSLCGVRPIGASLHVQTLSRLESENRFASTGGKNRASFHGLRPELFHAST